MNRKEILAGLRQHPDVTVLIVGGGINGLGTFRDLALQGIDVLLVERADFCSGASAASSHMVHGGIRYLENGEFRLVREAVQERNRLIRNAPQYVKPLATNIPIFNWTSGMLNAPLKFLNLLNKPSERGALVIKAGLMMYDAYTQDSAVPKHQFVLRQEALRKYPHLSSQLVSLATYYDAAMPSPERIAIDVMLDGEAANDQAHALNYVSAVGATGGDVTLRDELTGDEFVVQPQIVINAAGPWIDFANVGLGQKTKFIGGTKGSHIVLDHPELLAAIDGHEFFFENEDGRIVLIYPFVNRVLVGTSDLKINNPDEAVCTDEEIDYFMELIGRIFPKIDVSPADIVYRFSGVRPLPSSDANTTGQISRDHSNRVVEPQNGIDFPTFNLIGGKWTTFRAFSEQVADQTLSRLGNKRKVSTAEMPIAGGADYPQTEQEQERWFYQTADETGLHPERVSDLFQRYGTKAQAVAHFIAERGEDVLLAHHPKFSRGEIAFLVEHEKVCHIDDVLQRRTLLAMQGEVTRPLLEEVADVVAQSLGWSDEMKTAEIERVVQVFAKKHAVML